MIIHTVTYGETVYSIANSYGISAQRLIFDNQLSSNGALAVGQSLLILIPEIVHQVSSSDTLYSIARQYQTGVLQLVRNNPFLLQQPILNEGDYIVIQYQNQGQKIGTMSVNAYAYPFINLAILRESLLYMSELSIFSYGFTPNGTLLPTDDTLLLEISQGFGVNPILVLTPFAENGQFSNILVNQLLANPSSQQRLIDNLLFVMREKGYTGVDVDFEYILAADKQAYVDFLERLTTAMNAEDFKVSVALSPKTSSSQAGKLVEGLDYAQIGSAVNSVLVMTYEWGYTYGPPMAVAPLNKVEEVLNYSTTQIAPEKIDMGIPNYGYDWTLPFVKGESKAIVVGNNQAVQMAIENRVPIQFDDLAASPFFEYRKNGKDHIVWFEDPRSINAKLRLIPRYGFRGAGYWTIMRPFRQNFLMINQLFNIRNEEA